MGYNLYMRPGAGKFIVFEGIDGSGKTTISKLFFKYLKNKNINTSWFREPSDSKWGKKIRELADEMDSIPIDEEFKYFLKDRKWDVENNLRPSLKNGDIVILDRYYFSSACYQGARGMDVEMIISENRKFSPEPDLLFLIDVDIPTAMNRIRNSRDVEAKLFEKESFLLKVRKNYLDLKYDFIKVIDGKESIDNVLGSVIEEFEQFFLP